MFGQEVSSFAFWIMAVMLCIIMLVIVAQLSRFYSMFQEYRRNLDAHLIALSSQLKKQQTTTTELLIEQRRAVRLQTEAIELKQAEMTGDFDIVEEPVPAPAKVAVAPPPLRSEPPPRQFPDIG